MVIKWYRANLVLPFNLVLTVALIITLNKRYLKWSDKRKKLMDIAASYSFGIYLVHIIFLDIYKINVTADQYSVYLSIPLLFIVILAASSLIICLIRQLPFRKILI